MTDLENALNLLQQATAEFSQAGAVSANTFNQLSAAGARETTASDAATASLKKFKDNAGIAAKSLWDMSNSVRESRESLRSLDPMVRGFGSAVKSATASAGNAISDFGGALLDSKSKLAKFGGIIVTTLGEGIKVTGEAMKIVTEHVMPEVTKELDKFIEAYRLAGSVGVTGGMAIQGFADTAAKSGLSVAEFTNVIVTNSQDLQQGFGTALLGSTQLADGLEKMRLTFADGNDAATSYLNQLRNLGFVTSEVAHNMVQVQKLETLSGKMNNLHGKALADRTIDYTKNLDLLTRITGQRREQVEAEFKQMQKESTFKAGMQTFGQQFGDGGRLLLQSMSSLYGQDLAKGLMDALGTGQVAATEESIKLNAALGGTLPDIMKMVQDGKFSQESIIQAIQQMTGTFKEQGQARFGSAQQAALLNVRSNEPIVQAMTGTFLDANAAAGKLAAMIPNMVKDQQAAITTKSEAQRGINAAQTSMQELGVALDNNITKLLPNAGKAVAIFTEVTKAFATQMHSALTDAVGGKMPTVSITAIANSVEDAFTKAVSQPSGSATSTSGAPGGAPGGAATPGKPHNEVDINDILRMIAKVESVDYNSANIIGSGENSISGLRNMMIKDLLDKSSGSRWVVDGKEYSAIGRYQFIPATLRAMLKDSGIPEDTPFIDGIQDELARTLIKKQGFEAYKSGELSKEKFLGNLATQWAGLPKDSSGTSYYPDNNEAKISWAKALGSFAKGGISAGPKSGYAAMLHGTEAVVPLPDNRSIPVEFNNSASNRKHIELLERQMSKLDEIIYQMQTANNTSYQMLRNSIN